MLIAGCADCRFEGPWSHRKVKCGAANELEMNSWCEVQAADPTEPDERIAAQASAHLLLVGKRSQPFFVYVGINRPHLPFAAPKEFFRRYPAPSRIPLAKNREWILQVSARSVPWIPSRSRLVVTDARHCCH